LLSKTQIQTVIAFTIFIYYQ